MTAFKCILNFYIFNCNLIAFKFNLVFIPHQLCSICVQCRIFLVFAVFVLRSKTEKTPKTAKTIAKSAKSVKWVKTWIFLYCVPELHTHTHNNIHMHAVYIYTTAHQDSAYLKLFYFTEYATGMWSMRKSIEKRHRCLKD